MYTVSEKEKKNACLHDENKDMTYENEGMRPPKHKQSAPSGFMCENGCINYTSASDSLNRAGGGGDRIRCREKKRIPEIGTESFLIRDHLINFYTNRRVSAG